MMSYLREMVKSLLVRSDDLIARNYIRFINDRPGLIVLLFHNLFTDAQEAARTGSHPHESITLAQFRELIEYFLEQGFQFISDRDILSGLDAGRHYLLITFDDGYYANYRALPVIQEYEVPALFFISAGHISDQRAFWWEVLYRERKRQSISNDVIAEECASLVGLHHRAIEHYLLECFGSKALEPKSDLERPFRPEELRAFAAERYVFIGNHTRDHAYLPAYSTADGVSQITTAQTLIEMMTGIRPTSIAYPSGRFDARVHGMAQAAGMQLGFGSEANKNRPFSMIPSQDLLPLGRFAADGDRSIRQQCDAFRSDIQLATEIRRLRKAWGWNRQPFLL